MCGRRLGLSCKNLQKAKHSVLRDESVSRKEIHQLNLQYNQFCDDYEALKRELHATQEENQHLGEQLKKSYLGLIP
ncbi:uncharacterized protein LOC126394074 isoform X7 [Xyrichtys novacula]|uniref:Uncharacterized protein LOC126394074 isoform X7 n=1 Tax=Xyrichtys novacula TaxID=13765 RepID=A0AAV1H6X8_XYRNO|nr:uncharacterized protein LOC126394074 isoform X7 [Xyrichtys novacula]